MIQSRSATTRRPAAGRLRGALVSALLAGVLLAGAMSVLPVTAQEAPAGSVPSEPLSYPDDFDADGLLNADEAVYGTDPYKGDTDGDGVYDSIEVAWGMNPLVVDLPVDDDGDGLWNTKAAFCGTDPFNPDTDDDGLGDEVEVARGTNPLVAEEHVIAVLADTDGDGLGDGDEARRGTNPASFDTDRDGLRDGEEVLTYGTNPLVWDSNGNGISDWEDIAARTTGTAGNAPAPAPANEPAVNEPVEPMAPPVSAADQDKILDGNGTTACEIEGACGNGVSPDPHCFETDLQDSTRLSADC